MLETKFIPVQKSAPSKTARVTRTVLLVVLLAMIAVLVTRGISSRIKAASMVKQETLDLSVPSVSVIHPKLGALKDELVLPGNIQAFTDSPIYARASGYLKAWHADIGAHVKAGQLLAEIEAPELDQQVAQAKASLQQAKDALDQAQANFQQGKANADLARVTADRWKNLAGKGVVSRQENDQYQAQYKSQIASVDALEKAISGARSNVASSEANLARLTELKGYELVKAPFEGVITARNTDIGALINAGNGGSAQELFHMAATSRLRVYVSVPQANSRTAVAGITAELTLPEFPGRRFPGKLVRTAEAMDASTRTLLVEVDVDNASGVLRPGAYAEVHLKLPAAAPAMILPANALLFRTEGMQVGVVRNGNKVELVRIIPGKDYGNEIEVVSGIAETDNEILNPPDSLSSGEIVHVIPADSVK
jgi:RND family efflux transporter MFP subunit